MTTVRTISPVDGSTSAATDRDRSALVAWAPSIVGGAVTAANRPVVFATERVRDVLWLARRAVADVRAAVDRPDVAIKSRASQLADRRIREAR